MACGEVPVRRQWTSRLRRADSWGKKGGAVNGGPHLGQAATGEGSPLDFHTPGVGCEQPQGDVEGGRLARPVETEQPVDTAGIGRQVQIGEDLLATE